MLKPHIFHDYDIRGLYGEEFDEEGFYFIGCALAQYLSESHDVDEIAVGRDMRTSGPGLLAALIDGITDMGVNVINLGMISTEIQYFASGEYQFPANAIVSASHNPPEYNGLKVVVKGAIPLHGEFGLPEIQEMAMKEAFTKAETKGTVTERDIFDAWIQHCLKFIDLDVLKNMDKTLKIVVDAGNGMAGPTWDALKDHLPNVEIVPLYFKPDGTFPNHQPDPIKPKNIVLAQAAIKEHQADFCIALDGDADRAFIIDENAKFVSGTIVTAMLADEFLNREPGQMILYNVNVGKIVPELVKERGGTTIRTRVGHSFIKAYMREHNAIFAGEHSGHFYYRDNWNADSSTITGLAIIEYMAKQDGTFSEVTARFNKYIESGEINFKLAEGMTREQAINNMKALYEDAHRDETDGVSFFYDDWWFILRASKTEPVLRMNLEGDSQAIMEQRRDMIIKQFEDMGAVLK